MKLERTLKRRIGPAALWVWVIGLVAVLVIYRRLRGGSSASTGATDTTSSTPPSSTPPGTPSIAGAGSGADAGPLQPDAQQNVDPSISHGGTGTPVVYDPFPGDGGYFISPGFIPYTGPPIDTQPPPDPTPTPPAPGEMPPGSGPGSSTAGPLPVVHLAGGGVYDPNTDVVTLPKGRDARPVKATGQRSGARKQVPAPAMKPVAHPVAKATQPQAANARAAAPNPVSDVASSALRSPATTTVTRTVAPPPPPPAPAPKPLVATPTSTPIARAGRTVLA